MGSEAASLAAQDEVLQRAAEADVLFTARRVDGAGRPRESSRKTSIVSAPTSKIHGWVLCGLAASTAQATAPSGPGVSRHSSTARRPSRRRD